MVKKRLRSEGPRKESFLLGLTRRIPPGWLVAIVFSGVLGSFALFIAFASLFVPSQSSSEAAQCRQRCLPRAGVIHDDKDYPMSTRGQYRKVCRCS
ncbi:hypothetical protein [Acidovorax sp.]|uniref:hypothetical protein n=1 Tax=Acidovorax sp. TaxID=1872122 RepID=UPI003D0726CA